MRRLQAGAHRCLFVGDGGSDEHRGAANLGMTTVWLTTHVRPAHHERIVQRQGDAIAHRLEAIDRLAELLAKLEARGEPMR